MGLTTDRMFYSDIAKGLTFGQAQRDWIRAERLGWDEGDWMLFGDPTLKSTEPVRVPGDANYDGVVSFKDYIVLEAHFGKTNAAWADGDFNGDFVVNFQDYIILEENFPRAVPEPTSLLVWMVLLTCRLRRRRRQAD